MFRVVKYGTYLVEAADWYSSWHVDITQAMLVWSKTEAKNLADRFEAELLEVPCLN